MNAGQKIATHTDTQTQVQVGDVGVAQACAMWSGVNPGGYRKAKLAPREPPSQCDATPDARVDSIFKDARAALVRQFYYTAKRAQQTEREIRLRIPGWQPSPGEGPVAEWEREWLASGFFSDDGQCALPERIQLARGIAANDCASNTMALLSVEPCDRGGAPRVKVRLMVEAPGVIRKFMFFIILCLKFYV